MADNVRGFDHLTSVLMELAQQNRQEAIKQAMIKGMNDRANIKSNKPPSSSGQGSLMSAQLKAAKAAEGAYINAYKQARSANPTAPEATIRQSALGSLKLDQGTLANMTKTYGEGPALLDPEFYQQPAAPADTGWHITNPFKSSNPTVQADTPVK